MRTAVFKGVGSLSIEDRPEPTLEAGNDVVVRVLACGICGTDLHILADPPAHPATVGIILGHELVGEVALIGADVTTVEVGQRVAIRPIITCGTCRHCLSGASNHCENLDALGVYRDGGLATYARAPASACIPIDPSVPPHLAALTEPLACVFNAVGKARPAPGENAVVIGAGPIGLLFLAALRTAGAGRLLAVEPAAARADLARRIGADHVMDPTGGDVAPAVRDLLPDGPTLVIDAVGTQLAAAVSMADRRGRIVLFGMNTQARPEVPQIEITEKELEIVGSYVGQHSFPDAIRLLESGVIDLEPIVSHVVTLDELSDTIEAMRRGEVIKTVVTP